MNTELSFIRLVSGASAVNSELGKTIDGFGIKRAVLIIDENVKPLVEKNVDFLIDNLSSVEVVFRYSDRESVVNEMISKIGAKDVDAVMGIGGGKTIDVAKMIALKLNKNVVSFPTLVSHDGIASPVAVLVDDDGKKRSLAAKTPVAVIVDLEIISKAPIASVRAGVGDLVSNFSALEDWKLGAEKTGEPYHDLAAVISNAAASSIFDMSDVGEIHPMRYDFIRRLVQGLILSGVSMSVAGSSRPASGAEHNISHAIDALYNLNSYHGEQVALGTVFTTYLRGRNWEKYARFFKRFGLPTTCLDIGLSERDYVKAILEAPNTRKGRYTILNEFELTEKNIKLVLDAINERLAQ